MNADANPMQRLVRSDAYAARRFPQLARDEAPRGRGHRRASGRSRKAAFVAARPKVTEAGPVAAAPGRWLKAHKYFDYHVDKRGRLHWQKKEALIEAEQSRERECSEV
jgi:hypothetical protein